MSDYRESCIERKAIQIGMVDARPIRAAKKRPARRVVVEYRYPRLSVALASAWSRFGAYPDIETANQVIANKTRGSTSSAEYRIKP